MTNANLQILITVLSTLGSLFTGAFLGFLSFKTTAKYQIYKERLEKLYKPLYVTFDDMHLKYGAHEFHDLTKDEKEAIILIIRSNLVYADHALYDKYRELRWAIKSLDLKEQQECYIDLQLITANDFESIRRKLKLPSLFPK